MEAGSASDFEPGSSADFIRRYDGLFDFARMNTTAIGPRAGFSFLVTEDARNVLRGSIGRIHEAVNGRDAASFYSGAAGDSGGLSTRINQYDRNGDGIWETEVIRPRSTLSLDPSIEFDPDLTQPFVDEYIVGFRKQFPGLIAIDTALIHGSYKRTYALVDVNGIYPEAPSRLLLVSDVDDFLDYFFSKAYRQRIDYLWRPWLPDPKDDLVLECAVNSGAHAIVTFNTGHFAHVHRHFGILVLMPREFLTSREVFRYE